MKHSVTQLLSYFFASSLAMGASLDFPAVRFTSVLTGASSPTCATNAGDGSQRLFVTEQRGRILVASNGLYNSSPFLDITDRVLSTGIEQGLLSVAFPPGYNQKGFFFVDYTRKTDGAVVVSCFSIGSDPNLALAASERVILTIPKPFANHNGGQITFGPDGYLYVGVGDGGSEGDPNNLAQNATTMLGKLLRIDVLSSPGVPYIIPSTNPFVNTTGYLPEIWALGLRNPWRFSFDRLTGDLYIGDVGQNTWEEIDRQPAGNPGGQNYGWRIREGNHSFLPQSGFDESTLTEPWIEYHHGQYDLSSCVIGGFFYRGPSSPRMNETYFFGDYSEGGSVFGAKYDGASWQVRRLALSFANLSSFGEDQNGNIYLVDNYTGDIESITDSATAFTPTLNPIGGTYPNFLSVTFGANSGASIYYTTDGSTPSNSSASVPGSGAVSITAATTLKAFASEPGYADSPIVSASYFFQCADPVVNPPFGAISDAAQVTLSSATANATILYGINNGSPTVYTAPITINAPAQLYALATRPGLSNSGTASGSYFVYLPENCFVSTIAGSSRGFANGIGANAEFSVPTAICIDGAGNLYVSDTGNLAIRKVTPGGMVSTIAGTGTGTDVGAVTGIAFSPTGDVFFCNSSTGKLGRVSAGGAVSAYGGYTSQSLSYMEMDALGNLYFGDAGKIMKVAPNGVATLFAGSGTPSWQASPGVGIDSSGKLYVSNKATALSTISPQGSVADLCGNPTLSTFNDGPLARACFTNAQDICVDRLGNAYVFDTARIRMIRPNGTVSTLAGSGVTGFFNGPGTSARFSGTGGICVDANGVVYVADTENSQIRKIVQTDWDGDGVPDSVEGGTSAFVIGTDDRLVDTDGDGQSNAAEYFAGTNAKDRNSFFHIQSATRDVSGVVTISWNSVSGKRYQAQYSDDLRSWTNFGSVVIGTGQFMLVTDPSGVVSQRFYRIMVGVP